MSTNGNGHSDNNKKDDDSEVIRFPSLAERDRLRREQKEQEKAEEEKWRKEYRKQNKKPFFNTGKMPAATRNLALLFLGIHVVLSFMDPSDRFEIFSQTGFTPGVFTGAADWKWTALLTPITYNFIHGDWMHLIFNLVMTVVLGVFFQRELGTKVFFKIFFFCGLCGATLSLALSPSSLAPVIGASGALSGLFAMLLIFFHRQNPGAFGTIAANKYGVWPILGFWFAFMLFTGLLFGGIAWQAHIGGFLGGILADKLLKKGWIRF